MTPTITPGTRLDTADRRLAQESAFRTATAAEALVRSGLPGTSAALAAAELDILDPTAFPAAGAGDATDAVAVEQAESSRPGFDLDPRVTALVATPAGTRVEVTARILPSTALPPADPEPAVAELRLALLTDLPAPDSLHCPGSKGWIAELGDRLRADEEFSRLIETYDGTIGLSIGGREVHLRCYRGSLIEASARSILGADFVLTIPGAEFIALVQADHNTFMEAAMMRRMSSSGSGYEYLRMTSALVRIVDVCREIAVAAGYAGACADPVAASTRSTTTAGVADTDPAPGSTAAPTGSAVLEEV